MINYSYPLYRPPAEADNIIIQATYGCSHNRCSFCSMYKSKKYQKRDIEEIFREIDRLCFSYPDARKIFLADGDALNLPTSYLIKVLKYLKKSFVKLNRVSIYATAQNILAKSSEELKELRDNYLNLVYFGIETGSDRVLKKISKGVDARDMITSLNRATNANIKISATVILGIGGKKHSKEHTKKTANIINQTKVNYLSTLQLGLEEGIKDKFYRDFDDFIELDDFATLEEQKEFITQLNPTNRVIFRSNHASNALHLAGTFPKDKDKLLDELNRALNMGERAFVPRVFRGF